jgi:hypothetical protein
VLRGLWNVEVIDNCSQLREMHSPTSRKPAFVPRWRDYDVVKEN